MTNKIFIDFIFMEILYFHIAKEINEISFKFR